MDDIKDAFYLYSGTNVCNNSTYKQININTINNCLCFYAHEDSEIHISIVSGTTYYSNNATYEYIFESDIIKINNQGYDNQYHNYCVINVDGKASDNSSDISNDITIPSNSSSYVTINLSCGDRLYLWQNNSISNSQYNKLNITGTGKYSVSGDLRSLISRDLTISTLPTEAFMSLFANNTALYDASGLILPQISTLPPDCYHSMFRGCTQLRYPPKLPTATVSDNCYDLMFEGCSNLIVAPDINISFPASGSTESSLDSMFKNCTSLIQAPNLNFDVPINYTSTLYRMFYGCTSLIKGPDEIRCSCEQGCAQMFYGCTNLKVAPKLPNTKLDTECYYHMFYGCTSLEEAPELPALELADNCYAAMFRNCSKLKYIKADFLYHYDVYDNSCTVNWVDGVASEGLFYKNADGHFNETGVNGIPTGWEVRTEFPISNGLILWLDGYEIHRSTSTNNWYKSMCVPSLQSNWSIRFATTATTLCNGKCMKITGLNGGAHVQYSSSGTTANNPFYNIGMTEDSSMTYEMFIKLDKNQTESSDPNSSLRIGGMTYATGNSQYRWTWNVDGNGYLYIYTPLTGSTWTDVLHGAKSVTDGRYHHVVFQKDGTTIKFYIDGKLDTEATNSPWKLNVASGTFMVGIGRYDGLTSSTASSVRSHPGEYYSLSIYNRALSEDEIKLNYKILNERYNENYDYNYFYFENLGSENNYIALTKIGTNGPTLEYSYNTHTWTSWTYTNASEYLYFGEYPKIYLRGTNTYMSYSSSNYVSFSSSENVGVGGNLLSLLSTDLNTISTTRTYMFAYLFDGMSTLISAKKLHMPPSLYNYCYSYMFRGCTNLIEPPKLWVSNTLQQYAYINMFYGCTSLKCAPALWSRTLATGCYNNMFQNCSTLHYIKALFTTNPTTSYTSSWVSGVSSSGRFIKQTNATWTTTSVNGAPANWTIVKVDY